MDAAGRPTILVGVGGSAASAAALRWAAQEVRARHGRLQILLIWHSELRAYYANWAGHPDPRDQRATSAQALARTVSEVLGSSPRRNITAEVVEGTPERVLVAESLRADLLVLGSEARSTIGPVVRTCLAEAHCPVVVSQKAAPGTLQRSAQQPAGRSDYRTPSRRPVAAAIMMGRVPRLRLAK